MWIILLKSEAMLIWCHSSLETWPCPYAGCWNRRAGPARHGKLALWTPALGGLAPPLTTGAGEIIPMARVRECHLRGWSQPRPGLPNSITTQAQIRTWRWPTQHLPHLWPAGASEGTGPSNHSLGISMIRGNRRASKRSFSEGPWDWWCTDQRLWTWPTTHCHQQLQAKLFGQKVKLHGSQQLPTPPLTTNEWVTEK